MNLPHSNWTTDNNREVRDKLLFNQFAKTYSKKDQFKSSRLARKLRLMQTLNVLPLDMQNKPAILEVGCGAGYSVEYLEEFFKSYTGIDYSKKLIQFAKNQHSQSSIEFYTENLSSYKPEKNFDLIFMIGVLHHMPDIKEAIEKCISLLNVNGYLLINEPQPNNSYIHYLRKIRAKVDNSYSDEQEELEPSFLINQFQSAGLKNIRHAPQGIFSTPFAEVIINPQLMATPLSHIACGLDKFLEKHFKKLITNLSWNTIIAGQKVR